MPLVWHWLRSRLGSTASKLTIDGTFASSTKKLSILKPVPNQFLGVWFWSFAALREKKTFVWSFFLEMLQEGFKNDGANFQSWVSVLRREEVGGTKKLLPYILQCTIQTRGRFDEAGLLPHKLLDHFVESQPAVFYISTTVSSYL